MEEYIEYTPGHVKSKQLILITTSAALINNLMLNLNNSLSYETLMNGEHSSQDSNQ